MIKYFKKLIDSELNKLKWGSINLKIKDFYQNKFTGSQKGLESDILINDQSLIKDIITRGDLGFAEGYVNNKWDTSNLNNLLKILLKNEQIKNKEWRPNFFNKIIEKVNFIIKQNSIKQAKKNITFHYDLGNNFYKEWLDETMTYSSAIFKNKDISLKEAQINKYQSINENLNLSKNSTVCEIGSGWGGFINFIKNTHQNINVDGYTISGQQYSYVKKNFPKNINFEDYRNIKNKYSNVVSIEMFEAVGKKYWNTYFQKLNSILELNGSACLQIITINENSFSKYLKNVDFIQKYIFPGGMLPTKNIVNKLAKDNGFKIYHKISFGYDYAKTLGIWKTNFNNSWKSIKEFNFDEKFKRLWNYYLDYCETGFSLDHTDVTQFFIKKIN